MKVVAQVFAFLCTFSSALAWTGPSLSRKVGADSFSRQGRAKIVRLQSSREDVMGGVSEFENWFSSVPGADCSSSISHDNFGNLRGLTGPKNSTDPNKNENLMSIPKSIVLHSDFSNANWDAQLAEKLWHEVMKGPSSSISGYSALLTRDWTVNDLPEMPPSTAPDALRHWTERQKHILAASSAGQRLLDLEKQQEDIWRNKFATAKGMTWEQFAWAMEVVHSRAFCGDFGVGGSSLPPIATAAAPVLAAVAGYVYYVQLHGQTDTVLIGLGVAAAVPALLNILTQSPPAAILLPLIDSANHLEEANSIIEYSPLADSFTLTAGTNCIVEENGKQQLYVSYGKKKDTELLLNYGFLRGGSSDGNDDSRRKKLAESFIARQS